MVRGRVDLSDLVAVTSSRSPRPDSPDRPRREMAMRAAGILERGAHGNIDATVESKVCTDQGRGSRAISAVTSST